MTTADFVLAFAQALQHTRPALKAEPWAFPAGALLRFTLPPLEANLDPLALVWYARTGDVRTVVEAPRVAAVLGLDRYQAVAICDAADKPLPALQDPEARLVREALMRLVAAHFAPPG